MFTPRIDEGENVLSVTLFWSGLTISEAAALLGSESRTTLENGAKNKKNTRRAAGLGSETSC